MRPDQAHGLHCDIKRLEERVALESEETGRALAELEARLANLQELCAKQHNRIAVLERRGGRASKKKATRKTTSDQA